MTFNPLLLAFFIPLAGALGIAAAGRWPDLRESVTLATAVALVAVVWPMLPEVLAGTRPEAVLAEPFPGLAITFRLEPLGMMFAALASGLWIINSVYSIGYMRGNREGHQTRYYIAFAVAIGATMGIAFAGNLLTLLIFYEVLTLSTYPLVAHKGDETAVRGARTYIAILIATSIGLLLPAIVWTWIASGTMDFTDGGILAGQIGGTAAALLLALYVFGTGKAAVMPVHRWLPAAMVAPTPVSALLHAVAVVKAGVFVITKVVVYVFGVDFLASIPAAGWLLYAAGFTIVAASVVALRQDNLKRRLAYSTVSQLSYIVLAAALYTPLAIAAAMLHIVAHAFGKITLFFAAGSIYTAAHKTEISQLDGIGRRMPWTMGAFAIASLAMIGLPLSGGFVSKWFLIQGAIEVESVFALGVIAISTGLNAAYFLPIVLRAFFRAPPEADPHTGGEDEAHGEAPWPVVAALTATAFLSVLIFFYHAPLLELAESLLEAIR